MAIAAILAAHALPGFARQPPGVPITVHGSGAVEVRGSAKNESGHERTTTHVVSGVPPRLADDPRTPAKFRTFSALEDEAVRAETIELLEGADWMRMGAFEQGADPAPIDAVARAFVERLDRASVHAILRDSLDRGGDDARNREFIDELAQALFSGQRGGAFEDPVMLAGSASLAFAEFVETADSRDAGALRARWNDLQRADRPFGARVFLESRVKQSYEEDPGGLLSAWLPFFTYPFILSRRSAGGVESTDVIVWAAPVVEADDGTLSSEVWYAYVHTESDPPTPLQITSVPPSGGDPPTPQSISITLGQYARLQMTARRPQGDDAPDWRTFRRDSGSLWELHDAAGRVRCAFSTAYRAARIAMPEIGDEIDPEIRDADGRVFWSLAEEHCAQ